MSPKGMSSPFDDLSALTPELLGDRDTDWDAHDPENQPH